MQSPKARLSSYHSFLIILTSGTVNHYILLCATIRGYIRLQQHYTTVAMILSKVEYSMSIWMASHATLLCCLWNASTVCTWAFAIHSLYSRYRPYQAVSWSQSPHLCRRQSNLFIMLPSWVCLLKGPSNRLQFCIDLNPSNRNFYGACSSSANRSDAEQ